MNHKELSNKLAQRISVVEMVFELVADRAQQFIDGECSYTELEDEIKNGRETIKKARRETWGRVQ